MLIVHLLVCDVLQTKSGTIHGMDYHTYLPDDLFGPSLLGRIPPDTLARARRGHNERERDLPAILIWDTYNARVVDIRMVQEQAFELGRCNLEAFDFQYFLLIVSWINSIWMHDLWYTP